jgi:hypothetical protein
VRRAVPGLVAALGVLLVLTGLVLVGTAGADPVTAYDGTYAPLADSGAYRSVLTLTVEGALVWTRTQVVGAGVAVLGLLLLAAVAGWLLGLRVGRRARPS